MLAAVLLYPELCPALAFRKAVQVGCAGGGGSQIVVGQGLEWGAIHTVGHLGMLHQRCMSCTVDAQRHGHGNVQLTTGLLE